MCVCVCVCVASRVVWVCVWWWVAGVLRGWVVGGGRGARGGRGGRGFWFW